MKKLFTIFPFLFVFWLVNGQTALKFSNQAIVIGNSHHFKLASAVDEGASGTDQIWDFSGLKAQNDFTSYMLDATQTPNTSDIPDANVVIKENQSLYYFKVSKTQIDELGFASCSKVYRYIVAPVKMKFPFTYGNYAEGPFHGVDVNNANNQLSGTYKIEVDATGTLIIPGNKPIHNVVRLKSSRTDEAGASSNTTITYRWYSANVRYPLLTIIRNGSDDKFVTSTVAYYADVVSQTKSVIADDAENNVVVDENFTISAYPNPYTDKLRIDYHLYRESSVIIGVYDNVGKSIALLVNQKKTKGNYTEWFSGKDYGMKQGVYYLRVSIDGKITTKKIVQIDY
jgi:hypothetical protein